MNKIAWRMLTGDTGKYLALVFGVAFATHLMSQQVSVFMGVLRRTGNAIADVRDAGIWVMDPAVRYVDEVRPLAPQALHRVRGVEGVAWAAPLYKGAAKLRLPSGSTRNVQLTGVDDASLAGAPADLVAGRLDDLRQPDAILVDTAGHDYLWPGQPFRPGRVVYVNEHRAVLVGVCRAGAPFFSMPLVYARHGTAARFARGDRSPLTYVLAAPAPGADPHDVCDRIQARTGLLALTRDQFHRRTLRYYLTCTGIPVNFGVTIALGFLVGAAVTGQTLYLFTVENLGQYGALKAMGVKNLRLLRMILLQAFTVGGLGYGLGMGMTALFFTATSGFTHLKGHYMTWTASLGTGAAVALIVAATAVVCARRVLVLEPAVVFRT